MRRLLIILRRIAVYALFLFCLLLAFLFLGEPLYRGILLRNSILDAIASAKAIRVTEHSSPYDDWEVPKGQFQEQIFTQKELSTDQTESIKRAFPISLDYSGSVLQACIFDDHHRIELIQANDDIFLIDICFHCGELRIDQKNQRIMPIGWEKSLQTFFETLDMQPNREFRKLPPKNG